ncbi:MAG: YceI family protein [Alcanivoracaceae bacterium]|jgi:hypothetical protein|nr:YceI family protein [Alcanivoracaceae bacterium]
MKNLIKILLIVSCAVSANQAMASSPTEALAGCLVDTLNGKERKSLAKWIFFSVAAHPEIKPYSNASTKDIEDSDKLTGALITRLLTESCPNELKAANRSDHMALQKAFEIVGQVAMQELMTNDDVMRTISGYAKYVDQEKIGKLLN